MLTGLQRGAGRPGSPCSGKYSGRSAEVECYYCSSRCVTALATIDASPPRGAGAVVAPRRSLLPVL
jgi:hypothetical protein